MGGQYWLHRICGDFPIARFFLHSRLFNCSRRVPNVAAQIALTTWLPDCTLLIGSASAFGCTDGVDDLAAQLYITDWIHDGSYGFKFACIERVSTWLPDCALLIGSIIAIHCPAMSPCDEPGSWARF